MSTTATATDRLLEALAVLESTEGCLDGILISVPLGVAIAAEGGYPELAEVWRCFGDLATAVQNDLRGVSNG